MPVAAWARVAFVAMCVARGRRLQSSSRPIRRTTPLLRAALGPRPAAPAPARLPPSIAGPTEHPLAIAFGMLCSLFGQGGARLMVLGSILSYVALVAGMYRLGRLLLRAVAGLLAALLVLSRFFDENLAAQGYLDISYVALIVWAIVLEVERPRRGAVVLLALAAAGLLRPDAWVLSGAYWLWCVWPRLAPHKKTEAYFAGRGRRRDGDPRTREAARAGGDRAGRLGGGRRRRDRQPLGSP